MGKFRRGNYIFVTWIGDHAPRHVHIFDKNGLRAKFNLADWTLMEGVINDKILRHLTALRREGKL